MGKFIKSLGYAFSGIRTAFVSERNFRIQVVMLCLSVALGLYVGLSIVAWSLVILSMGFVLVAELFNTAVERLGDEAAHGAHNGLVKKAKDISAAAVLLSALTALIIGIMFLIVPLIHRLFGLR